MRTAFLFAMLSLVPVFADVIPSRPGRRADGARVAGELSLRGVNSTESAAQVGAMSSRDLAYFESDPRRVQLAAGVPIEDIILGAIFIAVAVGIAIAVVYQADR